MKELFTLKNPKDNFSLLAFQYHTLDYSKEILIKAKEKLKEDLIFRNKLNNYLLMERLSISQELSHEELPFDIKNNAKNYLKSNKDLREYMNISRHIVAKDLDMNELCSKIDLNDHIFVIEGKDLICIDCTLSTIATNYNDIEKEFLRSCAIRSGRVVKNNIPTGTPQTLYNTNNETNNLINVA